MLELMELNYIFHPKIKLKNIETIFKFGVCAKAENNYHAGWPATLPHSGEHVVLESYIQVLLQLDKWRQKYKIKIFPFQKYILILFIHYLARITKCKGICPINLPPSFRVKHVLFGGPQCFH